MITIEIEKNLKELTLQDCIELHKKMGITFIAHNGMITEILQEGGMAKINESK